MATQYIFVPGKIKWAKGLTTVDPEYKTYNAQMVVDDTEKARLEGAGCQATFKFSEEDRGFVFKIKKDSTRKQKDGTVSEASPPEVFLTDPDGKRVDLDPVKVGNGSEVTAKLELYDTKKGGKGTRLVGIRVETLIEFVPNEVVGGGDMPF